MWPRRPLLSKYLRVFGFSELLFFGPAMMDRKSHVFFGLVNFEEPVTLFLFLLRKVKV